MNLQNQIEYLNNISGVDLFDDCTVPDELDMMRVRSAIIMRCGLLTPLYSEPMTQRAATAQFFGENQWNFTHILNIVNAEYSPIENVNEDRTETEGIGRSHNHQTEYGRNTERTISAENVGTYSPDNKTVEGGSDTRAGGDSEDRALTVNRRGNIGVTTNQQMINEELDLLDRFNPYKFIADLYEKQLMIGLY